MGTKSGDFAGKNGHEYVVELEGANVEHAALTLGVPPVIISMAAGEHKFNGFKSTTAVVNIITDKPLVDLYSNSPTDILLTVTDVTDGDVVFAGYVTPFAFDQAYTGKADTFTANAVDLLSARKEVKYENIGEPYGTDRTALDIVQAVAERAGVTKIVEHINFDTPTGNGTSPLAVQVAQAGFLQDEVGELDALSAICKFFGYTCTLVGYTLYLYDEHCLLNAASPSNAAVHEYRSGRWVMTDYHYNSERTPLTPQTIAIGTDVRNDISVTIERAYDGIQITPEGSDTSVLLPDVCADENMEENDNSLGNSVRVYQDYNTDPDNAVDYMQWRKPLRSSLLAAGASSSSGPTDWPSGGDKMVPVSGESSWWDNGCMPIRLIHAPRKRFTIGSGSENISAVAQAPRNLLWLRLKDSGFVAKQRSGTSFSHTGGIVEVKMTYHVSKQGNWDIEKSLEEANGTGYVSFLQVRVGNQYFTKNVSGAAQWGSTPSALFASDTGKLLPTQYGSNNYEDKVLINVPSDGEIAIELRWDIVPINPEVYYKYPDIYIESLSVTAVGEDVDLNDADMHHEFVPSPRELMEVRTMLTTRKATSGVQSFKIPSYVVNARPSVVTDTEWNGGYMGRADSESIPISGILMEQLKARYAQPRIRFKMTVDKNINPYAAVYFGGKGYTVEAYDKDLYNSTTTITID